MARRRQPYPWLLREWSRESAREVSLPVPPDDIPEFYRSLGCPFLVSKTNERVTELADYQLEAIELHLRHRKLLVLKGQKMGLSSLFLLVYLWHALTDCQGYEMIIIAQSEPQAMQHADDLKKMLKGSRYRDYLIENPRKYGEDLLATQRTTAHHIYVANRDGGEPAMIHILSPRATRTASLKRVKAIFASDITFVSELEERQNLYFAALEARLTMTEGPIVIECPTVGLHYGPPWTIDKEYQEKMRAGIEPTEHDWHVARLPVQRAVDAGVVNPAILEPLRQQYGPLYDGLYNTIWQTGGDTWYDPNLFQMGNADMAVGGSP